MPRRTNIAWGLLLILAACSPTTSTTREDGVTTAAEDQWDSMLVDRMGLITFGGDYDDFGLGRYVHYELMGAQIVDTIPLIAPFIKHRMRGDRYVNEMDDRVVITWDLTEPFGGLQDVTFEPTPHHFQAVLYADGTIDLSYREMTARDAVVGVFTVAQRGASGLASEDVPDSFLLTDIERAGDEHQPALAATCPTKPPGRCHSGRQSGSGGLPGS